MMFKYYVNNDRKAEEIKRDSIISLVESRGNPQKILPPIFFKDINELSEDEVELLLNLIHMFDLGVKY